MGKKYSTNSDPPPPWIVVVEVVDSSGLNFSLWDVLYMTRHLISLRIFFNLDLFTFHYISYLIENKYIFITDGHITVHFIEA